MDEAPEPGDQVVHAVHGLGEVVAVETRQMPDGPVEYVSIDVEGMRVLVPLADLEDVGVRVPIDREEAEEILELLAGKPAKDPGHRGRRRRNQKRLRQGEVDELAKVVRSLLALQEESDKGLKHRDQAHLGEAMEKLVGEMAIALEISEDEARERVITAVEGAEAAEG